MVLQELKKGTSITLEVIWGNTKFEFETKVLASRNDGIIVELLVYNGIPLDLGAGKFKDISYNIYVITEKSQRIAWKNVQIEMLTLREQGKVYLVKTYNFAKNGALSERRTEERTVINRAAFLWTGDRKIPIKVYDISSKGISFYVARGVEIDYPAMSIEIEDYVGGKEIDFMVNCRFARRVDSEDESLIGCVITRETKGLLFYVFAKRLQLAKY